MVTEVPEAMSTVQVKLVASVWSKFLMAPVLCPPGKTETKKGAVPSVHDSKIGWH